ncbi:hypothetical protein [Ferruginibacter sp.]
MIAKKIDLLILFTLFIFFANAQNDNAPSSEPEKSKVIKMPRFPVADFPKKSIHVSNIQIIQMVRDSVKLGYVLKGLGNQVVEIMPSKPLTFFLQEHIIKMYKNDYKEDGVKILWVLKDLRVGEKTGFMEYAYTKFNALAYISSDEKQYKFVTAIDTVFVKQSGGDVTAWHGEDIENVFKLMLKQTLKNAVTLNEQNVEKITIEQIVEKEKQPVNIPILSAAVYNEGGYANFQEFLDNKPSVTIFSPVAIGKKKLKFISMNSNNQADTLSIWGLCKNGEIFKYEDDVVIPIEKYDDGFIISNYISSTNRRNGNRAFSAFIGGVAGALISTAASGRPLLVKSIPYITKTSWQPEASCIDMKTGELSF